MAHTAIRILVVKLSSLGDLFHALPAVDQLQRGLDAEVDWVVQPEYRELVASFGPVQRVVTFPRRAFRSKGRAFLRELRSRHYDYVFDFQGILKSAFVAKSARAVLEIGPSFAREGTVLMYNQVATSRGKVHAIEQCLDSLGAIDLAPGPVRFPVDFPVWGDVPTASKPLLALAPRSRWGAKDWPLQRFAEVVRRVGGRARWVVVGSADDVAAAEELMRCAEVDVTSLCGRTSLLELGGVLREVDGLLTNDSGPMHLAAAVGTPTSALFGPTDHRRTGPFGADHVVMRPSAFEGQTLDFRNDDDRHMRGIGVEAVVQAVQRLLNASLGG